jgi:hypothetical protein
MEWFVDEPHRGQTLLGALALLIAIVGIWLGRRELLLTIPCVLLFLVFAAMVIPSFIPARTASQRIACTFHLRAIADAKAQWARANSKQPTDTPTAADLYGEGKPLRHKHPCPRGGTYVIGTMKDNPTCSFADKGHKL